MFKDYERVFLKYLIVFIYNFELWAAIEKLELKKETRDTYTNKKFRNFKSRNLKYLCPLANSIYLRQY